LDLYEQSVIEVFILQQDRITGTQLFQLLNVPSTEPQRGMDGLVRNNEVITTEITHCELHRTTVDTTWLELIYHIVGPCPAVCPDRDSVQGSGYPEMPPYPCQAAYVNDEYASLPGVPIPPLSEVNSHCNFRPDCKESHLPELAVCSHDLACVPGTPPVTTASPPTLPPVTHPPGTESCGSPQCTYLPVFLRMTSHMMVMSHTLAMKVILLTVPDFLIRPSRGVPWPMSWGLSSLACPRCVVALQAFQMPLLPPASCHTR